LMKPTAEAIPLDTVFPCVDQACVIDEHGVAVGAVINSIGGSCSSIEQFLKLGTTPTHVQKPTEDVPLEKPDLILLNKIDPE